MPEAGGVRLDTSELDRLLATHETRADEVLSGGAFSVEGTAKMLAPVDTGALRNSVNTQKQGRLLYWVQDGVEYGIYQELGTRRMASQPFMVPALEHHAQRIIDSFKAIFT